MKTCERVRTMETAKVKGRVMQGEQTSVRRRICQLW